MALESGQEKVKEICEIIRSETLQPAKDEAQRIINEANAQADAIIARANEDAEEILKNLKKELEKTQKVAESSIELSIKQGLSKLRQLVIQLFSDELLNLTSDEFGKEDVMVRVINSLVEAIEKEGIESKLALYLGKNVSKEQIIGHLAAKVREKLENGTIEMGDFPAGMILKIVDKKMAIEVTDKALVKILSDYISSDLKDKLFQLV